MDGRRRLWATRACFVSVAGALSVYVCKMPMRLRSYVITAVGCRYPCRNIIDSTWLNTQPFRNRPASTFHFYSLKRRHFRANTFAQKHFIKHTPASRALHVRDAHATEISHRSGNVVPQNPKFCAKPLFLFLFMAMYSVRCNAPLLRIFLELL